VLVAPGPAKASTAVLPAADSSPSTPPAGSLVGRTIGDFAIEGVIGSGSFGTVYRGRQLGLDRPVAIKVPSYEIAADPVQARRFAREARAAARIVHPGVVAIYAVGELDDGRPYLAMQLIEGEPLDRILAAGPVPALRALRIVRGVASALSETHAAGVIHRDLKPSNVMWRRDRNGDDRITLVDFGIAVCRPGHADASRLTSNGLIGTPHYMSPELAQGENVDGRADLYALGCLLFELTTGTTPFAGGGFEVLLAHLGRPAPRPTERHAEVPAIVDRLVEQLMQKRPDDRPASADAVVALLDDAIAELERRGSRRTRRTTRPPVPAVEPGRSRPGSRRRIAFAALAVVAVAVSGAGFAGYRLRGEGHGDDRIDEPEPSETQQGTPMSASGEPLRLIARDDGELIIRTLVPEVIHAGLPIVAHLEIKTKLGGQFGARQVVVTIEDPAGNATAQTAAMHGDQSGHYVFHHTFAVAGRHIVRIFPSETESMSTIELGVEP
jgi:serine/threonine-protein kinase